MRCFPLFWGVFAGEKGQGGEAHPAIFWVFPGRDGAASTEIASWELAGLATKAEGEGQLAAGGRAGIGDNQLRVVRL